MNWFETALELLSSELRQAARYSINGIPEEIRLRVGYAPHYLENGQERVIEYKKITEKDLVCILEKATGASMHTVAHSISNGYVNYKGIRVGICGEVSLHNSKTSGFRHFSSLAIRIPKECRGICDEIIREIYSKNFESTIIISPPGGGKTTFLRESIRNLSDLGFRIGVVDERSELSSYGSFDLGSHSDVLTGVPKVEGALMLLKGMNPQIIAIDEIVSEGDIAAIENIIGCGVEILATAHAAKLGTLTQRPLYDKVFNLEVFKYCVTISNDRGKRRYTAERIVV